MNKTASEIVAKIRKNKEQSDSNIRAIDQKIKLQMQGKMPKIS